MTSNTVIFEGYLAELIRLQAEKCGLTPEVYIISFFANRCNAPIAAKSLPVGDYFLPQRCIAPLRKRDRCVGGAGRKPRGAAR